MDPFWQDVCSWFSQYLPSCAKRSLARFFCKEPTSKKIHQENGKFSKCWDNHPLEVLNVLNINILEIKVSFNECKKVHQQNCSQKIELKTDTNAMFLTLSETKCLSTNGKKGSSVNHNRKRTDSNILFFREAEMKL